MSFHPAEDRESRVAGRCRTEPERVNSASPTGSVVPRRRSLPESIPCRSNGRAIGLAIGEYGATEHSVSAFVPSSEYLGAVSSVRQGEGKSLFHRQLRVIQEMIDDLDSQIAAGQRHTMEKVAAFLRSHIGLGAFSVNPRNGRELSQMVDQLEREARRQVPDIRLFGDRAKVLVALLSVTTPQPPGTTAP